MGKTTISGELISDLKGYLKRHHRPELISTYLFYVSKKFDIHPTLSPKHKIVYRSLDEAVKMLGESGQLWRETKIRIGSQGSSVNGQTKKIYICPFTGKVFADNTHPNPQDAIYDWVLKCPENTERNDGMRVKRFYVSEDPEVIKKYIKADKVATIKGVYSSVITGSLFNSKESVIEDFKQNFVKEISLQEILNQNRYQLEESFLKFIQDELAEDNLTTFIEALSEYPEFPPYIETWLEDESE